MYYASLKENLSWVLSRNFFSRHVFSEICFFENADPIKKCTIKIAVSLKFQELLISTHWGEHKLHGVQAVKRFHQKKICSFEISPKKLCHPDLP